MFPKARNLAESGTHRESDAPSSFGCEMRLIGPVWRGTPLALRRRMMRRSSERRSHPSGIGASRRSAPELDSNVSHPFSNPGVMTAPLIGTVFQTRHEVPVASSKSRLAMSRSQRKEGSTIKPRGTFMAGWCRNSSRAKRMGAKCALHHHRGEGTEHLVQSVVRCTACELTTPTPRTRGIGTV